MEIDMQDMQDMQAEIKDVPASIPDSELKLTKETEEAYQQGMKSLLAWKVAEAHDYFIRAIAGNHPAAYIVLGIFYRYDEYGKSIDQKRSNSYFIAAAKPDSLAWLKKNAITEQSDIQWCLFRMYITGFEYISSEEKEALDLLQSAAAQDNVLALTDLSDIYKDGVPGITKDKSKSHNYLLKAASIGFAQAQFNLGKRYHIGLGVEKDLKEAVTWYQRAADQNYSVAQNTMGINYRSGSIVKKDEQKEIMYYELASAQNYPFAQHNLGVCYKNGTGVEEDMQKAIHYFQLAAINNLSISQITLGSIYKDSLHKNLELALYWFEKAAQNGTTINLMQLLIDHVFNYTQYIKDRAFFWFRKLAAEKQVYWVVPDIMDIYWRIEISEGEENNALATLTTGYILRKFSKKNPIETLSILQRQCSWFDETHLELLLQGIGKETEYLVSKSEHEVNEFIIKKYSLLSFENSKIFDIMHLGDNLLPLAVDYFPEELQPYLRYQYESINRIFVSILEYEREGAKLIHLLLTIGSHPKYFYVKDYALKIFYEHYSLGVIFNEYLNIINSHEISFTQGLLNINSMLLESPQKFVCSIHFGVSTSSVKKIFTLMNNFAFKESNKKSDKAFFYQPLEEKIDNSPKIYSFYALVKVFLLLTKTLQNEILQDLVFENQTFLGSALCLAMFIDLEKKPHYQNTEAFDNLKKSLSASPEKISEILTQLENINGSNLLPFKCALARTLGVLDYKPNPKEDFPPRRMKTLEDFNNIKIKIKPLPPLPGGKSESKISMIVPEELVDRLSITEEKVDKIERKLLELGLEKATNAILKQKFSPMDNPRFEDEYQQLKSIVSELKSEEKSGKMNQQQIQQLTVIAAEMIDAQRHQEGQIKEIQGALGQQPHTKKLLEIITKDHKLNQYYEFVTQHLTQTIIAAIAIGSSKVDLSMLKVGWLFSGLEKIVTAIPFVGSAVSLLALIADPIQEGNKIRKTRNLSRVARCFKNDILVARRVVMQFAIELTISKTDEIYERCSASSSFIAKAQKRYRQLETFLKEKRLLLSSKEQLNNTTRLAIYDVQTILDTIEDSQFASEDEIFKLSQDESELIARLLKIFIDREHRITMSPEEEKLPRPSRVEILARINSSNHQRKFAIDERLRVTIGRLTAEIFTTKLDTSNIESYFSKKIQLLLLKSYALATGATLRESELQKPEIPGIKPGHYRYFNFSSANLTALMRLIFNFADMEAKYDQSTLVRESEKLCQAITSIGQHTAQNLASRYQQSLSQLAPNDLTLLINVAICRILTYLESIEAMGERDILACLLHGCLTPNYQLSAILSKNDWPVHELLEQVGVHTESGFYYHQKQPAYRYGYCEISEKDFSDLHRLSGGQYVTDRDKNYEKYKLIQSTPEPSELPSTASREQKDGVVMHQRLEEFSRQVEYLTQQNGELSRQVKDLTQQNQAVMNILKQLILSPALNKDLASIPLTALLAASYSSDLPALRENKNESTLLPPSSSSSQTLWSGGPRVPTGREAQSTDLGVNFSLLNS
jgi:TPR repeat protein